MDLYRRMAAVRNQEDADELLDEIVDRYGDPPKSVLNLLDVAMLRAAAAACGIREIVQRESRIAFTLDQLALTAVAAVCAEPAFRGRVYFSAGSVPLLDPPASEKRRPSPGDPGTSRPASAVYRCPCRGRNE